MKRKNKNKKKIKVKIEIRQYTNGDIEKKHKLKHKEELPIFESNNKIRGNNVLRCDERF